MFREFITDQVLVRVAAALDRPNARLRATLVASQLIGLAMVRYVVQVEPLASTPVDQGGRCGGADRAALPDRGPRRGG